MDVFIKLNNQTTGRDKIARLIQYASKSVWYMMLKQRHIDAKTVELLRSLEYNMATFRKLLRFGRFADHAYLAIGNFDNTRFISLTHSAAKLAYSAFLLCDHVIWIARAGLYDADTNLWANSANRCWAITVALQLLIDGLEIYRIINCRKSSDTLNHILVRSMKSRKDLMLDTLKNVCDLMIPLSGLGIIRTNPGIIGAVGMISSLAGLMALISPKYRFTVS